MRGERKGMWKLLKVLCVFAALVSCRNDRIDDRIPFKNSKKEMNIERTSFAKLPGWKSDDQAAALASFKKSCDKIASEGEFVASNQLVISSSFIGEACRDAPKNATSAQARAFFEKWFEPYLVSNIEGKADGLVTGYYEAEVEGSHTKTARHTVPIYGRPDDLSDNSKYKSRREIETRGLEGAAPVLFWAKSASEVHVLHIQGSGRVKTPDGQLHRIGFGGANGHAFKGIGGILKENNVDVGGTYSMVNVKKWLDAHPEAARKFMQQNDRFIFFRRVEGDGPVGALGVALTPMRSIAVDNDFIPLGMPLFLTTTGPDGENINKLVVAQDIGSAIKGAVRVDLFYGFGQAAFDKAGRMSSQGRYYILLPKDGKSFAAKR